MMFVYYGKEWIVIVMMILRIIVVRIKFRSMNKDWVSE